MVEFSRSGVNGACLMLKVCSKLFVFVYRFVLISPFELLIVELVCYA